MDDLNDLTDREKQFLLARNQLAIEKQRILDEKNKAEDEFGKIRAKFKDLYLQREDEISKIREEKLQLEIEISDVRAAALVGQRSAQDELDGMSRHYTDEINLLKSQLKETQDRMKSMSSPNQSRSDIRGGSNASDDTSTVEDLENSMLKAKKDSEMLKEIILPLETELAEVKLQCQKLMSENMRLKSLQEAENRPQPTVDMLLNLDDDLDDGTEIAVEPEDYLLSKEKVDDLEEELAKLRTENTSLKSQQVLLAESFNALKEDSSAKATELEELKRTVQTTETKWSDLTSRYTDKVEHVTSDFKTLRSEHDNLKTEYEDNRNNVSSQLDELEQYKEKLVENFNKLKMKLNDERKTHEDAQALLTDSLESCRREIHRLEYASEELKTNKELNEKLQLDVINVTEKLNETQRKSKEVILELQKQILSGNAEKEQLNANISRLQKELAESLSVRDELAIQSSDLQVKLEHQNELLSSIKWEHEDDVTNCRRCQVAFSMTKRKNHCRKCGRIFCADCCGKTIECGENKRQYKACDECYLRHKAEKPTEYHTVTIPRT